MSRPSKVLTIDGGGVFGLVPATLLEDYSPYAIFDAFGGTSIGSAIAAYYACGLPAKDLPGLMLNAFPEIFTAPWYRYCWARSSKYPSNGLVKFLTTTFGDRTFAGVLKPLYVVSFDFSLSKPKVFSSVGDQDKDIKIADAVHASVAAPTYFEPYQVNVDGGLWANNPSVVATAGIAKNYDLEFKDLSLLSLGTGDFPEVPTDMDNSAAWGLAEWGLRIIPAMLNGNVKGFEFIASQLPFKSYLRYNSVALNSKWAMDDTSDLQAIIDATKPYKTDFETHFDKWLKEAE